MFSSIARFFRRNEGQDLSEYCLLTALIALIALGIFWHLSGGIQALWSNGGTSLASAHTATGTNSGSTTTSSPSHRDGSGQRDGGDGNGTDGH